MFITYYAIISLQFIHMQFILAIFPLNGGWLLILCAQIHVSLRKREHHTYLYNSLCMIQYPTISNLNLFICSHILNASRLHDRSTNQPFMKSVSKLDTQMWWNINHSHLMVLSYQYCIFFLGVQFHHTTLQPGSTWTHHNAADNGFGLGCTYAPLSWPFPSFTTVQPVLHIELNCTISCWNTHLRPWNPLSFGLMNEYIDMLHH